MMFYLSPLFVLFIMKLLFCNCAFISFEYPKSISNCLEDSTPPRFWSYSSSLMTGNRLTLLLVLRAYFGGFYFLDVLPPRLNLFWALCGRPNSFFNRSCNCSYFLDSVVLLLMFSTLISFSTISSSILADILREDANDIFCCYEACRDWF